MSEASVLYWLGRIRIYKPNDGRLIDMLTDFTLIVHFERGRLNLMWLHGKASLR